MLHAGSFLNLRAVEVTDCATLFSFLMPLAASLVLDLCHVDVV